MWLGGLFNPEAYITATRQYVAQANGWSLEELSLDVLITDSDKGDVKLDECSFGVTGTSLKFCFFNLIILTIINFNFRIEIARS